MPKSSGDDLTKQDLEKTLEAHAKTIELQILISQQQNKLLEQLETCHVKMDQIEAHFSNGFRSELKNYTHQEVQEVKDSLSEMKTKLEEIDRRTWQQMWIWGGIALFTLANAVILVVGLWQNAWIIKS